MNVATTLTTDIAGVIGVVTTVTDGIDSLDAVQAIELLHELKALNKAVADAISLCNTQALQKLDGQPVQVDDTVYARQPVNKKRANHTRLAQRVADIACVDENGKPFKAKGAIAAAVQAATLMRGLYVSDSTLPKIGELKRLGIAVDEIIGEERTGWEVKETKLKK